MIPLVVQFKKQTNKQTKQTNKQNKQKQTNKKQTNKKPYYLHNLVCLFIYLFIFWLIRYF